PATVEIGARLDRVLVSDPRAAGIDLEGDPGQVLGRAEGLGGGALEGALEVLARAVDVGDAVHPEHAVAWGGPAVGVEVPGALAVVEAQRLDRALGVLVAGVAEVADVERLPIGHR